MARSCVCLSVGCMCVMCDCAMASEEYERGSDGGGVEGGAIGIGEAKVAPWRFFGFASLGGEGRLGGGRGSQQMELQIGWMGGWASRCKGRYSVVCIGLDEAKLR